MHHDEIAHKFLEYFKKHNHLLLESSSLIPQEADPSALFINSGMHPIKKYFLGLEVPPSQRLCSIQRCFRSVDIDNVGENKRTLTFFFMLGNWSIGEYWKEEAVKLNDINNWLNDAFVPLMLVMEKHVMAKIQQDFNLLFREWFSTLIDDSNLTARIDTAFEPIIEQNGYQTSFEHLSGGEKTSVALAYRLALNKIVNALSETIRTKDLLILD